MAELSTSNLLWYIYKRNCAVGYPTVITMREFLYEFQSASRQDIIKELDNLITGMEFVRRKFICVYDLTEAGLTEVLHLENFVIKGPFRKLLVMCVVLLSIQKKLFFLY